MKNYKILATLGIVVLLATLINFLPTSNATELIPNYNQNPYLEQSFNSPTGKTNEQNGLVENSFLSDNNLVNAETNNFNNFTHINNNPNINNNSNIFNNQSISNNESIYNGSNINGKENINNNFNVNDNSNINGNENINNGSINDLGFNNIPNNNLETSEDFELGENFGDLEFDENFYNEKVFKVFDEHGVLIFERSNVNLGDIIIDRNLNCFEIVSVDEQSLTAIAKFTETLKKPSVSITPQSKIGRSVITKKIALYNTHNDESYEIGDGYSSIYGAGGIHDIAKNLQDNLSKLNINVDYNQTLHIPHNSSAYSRSLVTAKALLSNSPDAIFDIHRDGASRSTYVKNVNGKERCQVRIVVGQANPNKQANLQFATYLMTVAEKVCPWLFLDIYYAKGEYNQSLTSKALLFEMGSHLVEKSLVQETVPYLADVINTTLFNTSVNSNNQLTITPPTNNSQNSSNNVNNNQTSNSQVDNSVNEVLDSLPQKNSSVAPIVISILLVLSVSTILIWYFIKTANKKKKL